MLNRSDFRPYQVTASDFIVERPVAALFADMGTGKTGATLDACQRLADAFEVFRILVVAPKRVALHTWPDELEEWAHIDLDVAVAVGAAAERRGAVARGATVTVVNVDVIPWLVREYRDAWPFDMVVVDESSLFKSHSSQRFKALRKVRRYIRRVVLLSGTPAPNSYLELWPQFFLLDQGVRLMRTFTGYRDRWFTGDYMGWHWTLRPGAREEIEDKIADICLRLDGEELVGLPPALVNEIRVELPAKVRKQYQALERDSLLELEDETVAAFNAGALVNKLLQFTGGAVYGEDGETWTEVHDEKLRALDELVETAAGEPLLVAYSFRSEVARIRARYPKAELLGDDPTTVRRWNAGEIPLLLAHPQAAGHGLNLQAGGRRIIWLGLSWSLELYQQFNARLRRPGQRGTVIVNHIVADDTVDDAVLATLRSKNRGQAALLDALRERGKALGVLL